MKTEIPENRTKAYWEPRLREMRPVIAKKNLRTIVLRLSILFVVLGIVMPILSAWELGPGYRLFYFVCCEGLVLFTVGVIFYSYRGRIRKKLQGDEDPEVREEAVFYDLTDSSLPYIWFTAFEFTSFHLPDSVFDVDLNEIFPEAEAEGMEVIEFCMDCSCGTLHCFGTREKYEVMEKLIHMVETLTRRKKSRIFMVTYKKNSRELVKIELSENEEYPAHCNYEELVERINVMF